MAENRFGALLTHVIAGAVGAGIVIGAQYVMQNNGPESTDTEDEFGTSVREYLNDNPDVVVDAIKKYQAKEEQKQLAVAKQFVKDNKSAIYNNAGSPVVGNPDGDVTLVEFYDYNCHFCRGVAPDVAKLIADDPKLRVVHKQLPILGPESVEAAKVALAAHMQSQALYEAVNKAFWAHEGRLTNADIEKIARDAGAKWDQIVADKESDAVLGEIKANYDLAQKLGLSGTPGFIIGDNVFPGTQNYDQLKADVAAARAAVATSGTIGSLPGTSAPTVTSVTSGNDVVPAAPVAVAPAASALSPTAPAAAKPDANAAPAITTPGTAAAMPPSAAAAPPQDISKMLQTPDADKDKKAPSANPPQ